MAEEYVFAAVTSCSFLICCMFTALTINYKKYVLSSSLHLLYNFFSLMQVVLSWLSFELIDNSQFSIDINNIFFVLSNFFLYLSTRKLIGSRGDYWILYAVSLLCIYGMPSALGEQKVRIIILEIFSVILPMLFLCLEGFKQKSKTLNQYLSAIIMLCISHAGLCAVAFLGLVDDSASGGNYYRFFYYLITTISVFVSLTFIRYVLNECYSNLHSVAREDYLTGLYNRRYFEREVNRRKPSFILGLIDLDNFKDINDTFGHKSGDYILKSTATYILCSLPKDSIVARIGGEEFAFFIPGSSELDLNMWFHGLQSCLYESKVGNKEESINVSISCGISLVSNINTNYETAFLEADQALYYVKRNGKNSYLCVHI